MKIKCPGCSAVLNIPESAAGKVVKCPCGKQLRAPGGPAGGAKPAPQKPATGNPGAAKPAAAKPAAARPAAARPPAPARPSTPAADGFDPAMFDELTDQDLKPMPSARAAAPRAPSGGGKLMQQYAPTGGGGGGGQFRRGPIASPWVRLGAAILDGFIIGFIVAPILIGCMFVLTPMFVDTAALQNAQELSQGERDALAAQAAGGIMMAYFISVAISYSIPIVIYAIMVTKSGQTPGKKVCGIRIVTSDTQQLPGFVKGVLLRSWLINVLYAIPMLALIDYAMIFGEKRQCLHDLLAGTIVIES